jgi:aspartate 1-decarboxylase
LEINGAAAHLIGPGDIVIVAAYGLMDDPTARTYHPTVAFVDADNAIVSIGTSPGEDH